MNNNAKQECLIWKKASATVTVDIDFMAAPEIEKYHVNSVRAGGKYRIDSDAMPVLEDCDDRTKARLTTWLLDQRKQGTAVPTITEADIESARKSRDLPVDERADRLLAVIEQQTSYNGEPLYFHESWIPRSESINEEEVRFLAEYLAGQGLLIVDDTDKALAHQAKYILTVGGYIHLSQLKQANPESTRAFVAMWFGGPDGEKASMDAAYDQGFKPAIEKAGYRPVRIDKKEHLNRIDDEIIAEILRSRFIIADFTQGKSGVRGGVYFEAGFAKGRNIKVIFTCRKDSIDHVHFDTRQYRHIVWEKPDDLQSRLLASIRANIGQGPFSSKS